jgi:UDP-2,3-diacylglucosamine pyrophosphatase LpxH
MSDCHRGDGSWADTFSKNQNIYFAALNYYYYDNYTYIEIGDGDELWENNNISNIIKEHKNAFLILKRFFNKKRLYLIYGNHDIVKQSQKYVKQNLYYYYDEREKKKIALFKGIKVHEGLVLKQKDTQNEIFLVHGHQVDFLNSTLWRLTRFLVRYLWRPLEIFGVNDPTSTAKNYRKKESVEKRLSRWVQNNDSMIVAGHTHRPVFPEVGETRYFNDGSCVHPHGITAIEIANSKIQLVKWSIKTKDDNTLYVGRDIILGPTPLADYFA